jgi:hypothetical protein
MAYGEAAAEGGGHAAAGAHGDSTAGGAAASASGGAAGHGGGDGASAPHAGEPLATRGSKGAAAAHLAPHGSAAAAHHPHPHPQQHGPGFFGRGSEGSGDARRGTYVLSVKPAGQHAVAALLNLAELLSNRQRMRDSGIASMVRPALHGTQKSCN